MLVKRTMSKNVVSVSVPGNREKVLDLMRKENKAVLPVVKEDTNILVGVITRSDLINNPDEYVAKLRDAHVYVDQEERRQRILDVTKVEADKIGAVTKISDDLLDEVTRDFANNEDLPDDTLKFCIIGRPNVGKSSLTNAILGEQRSIVSDVAGTTRDSIDTKFKYNGEEYIVIDTAGMRKKGRIYENIEKYSLLRSLKAIDRSDVCVLVIDASTGIIEHDKHIAGYAIEAGKGLVLVVNKWDVIEDKDKAIREWKELLKAEFQFMTWTKIVFLSALTKKRIHTLMPEIISAYENNRREVKTSILNNVITDATKLHEAPGYKGKKLKIYFSSQTGICPPKFTFRCNNKGLVHFSYERYLENTIRNNFDFTGTPITLQFKNRGSKDEDDE